MGAVSPVESDLSVGKGNQAVVGNGHSKGVAAEIAEHIFRAAKGPFAVNDPFVRDQLPDEGVKRLRVRQVPQLAMETDFAPGESLLESFREFGSKHDPQHLPGQKEAIVRIHSHPAPVVERQSTCRDQMFRAISPDLWETVAQSRVTFR